VTANVSWRWRLAGQLRALPEFRGRDRLGAAILRGVARPAAPVRCVIGTGAIEPALVFDARMNEDGSWVDLFFLQYETPALTPLLETFVTPGSTFVDVGANIGIYSGWASRLAGPRGRVLAFEPVPATRAHLNAVVALNQLANVEVIPKALGKQPGTLTLWVVPHASGLTSAVPPEAGSAAANLQRVDVPQVTLDDELASRGGPGPSLVKIDVEGYEMAVLEGVTRTLARPDSPAVVFETHGAHLARAGVRFADVPGWFEDQFGYELYGMFPGGLRRISRGTATPPATNTLALHPERHKAGYQRLMRVRFRRNQSC
jgi:FkbM family methyltransferase